MRWVFAASLRRLHLAISNGFLNGLAFLLAVGGAGIGCLVPPRKLDRRGLMLRLRTDRIPRNDRWRLDVQVLSGPDVLLVDAVNA